MKQNRLLYFVNMVLGSLSILLAGCHTQKNAAKAAEDNRDEAQPVVEQKDTISDRVICMYGVPAEIYERPALKYGVPDGREKKKK